MTQQVDKLNAAFNAFDQYNKQDPHTFLWDGNAYPQEYFLSLKLYDWVIRLNPTATEPLLLASRSQHIGRWEIPRSAYPLNREGYLAWRKALGLYHAEKSGQLMQQAGYTHEIIDRVKQIILKQKLKVDEEVQTMENALCLVFLQFQYEAFWPQYPEKIVGILRKSLKKMDAEGHRYALTLEYSEQGRQHIQSALDSL